jgi:hypothetical protein
MTKEESKRTVSFRIENYAIIERRTSRMSRRKILRRLCRHGDKKCDTQVGARAEALGNAVASVCFNCEHRILLPARETEQVSGLCVTVDMSQHVYSSICVALMRLQ